MYGRRRGHDTDRPVLVIEDLQVGVNAQLSVDRRQNFVIVHGPILRRFAQSAGATENLTVGETTSGDHD